MRLIIILILLKLAPSVAYSAWDYYDMAYGGPCMTDTCVEEMWPSEYEIDDYERALFDAQGVNYEKEN